VRLATILIAAALVLVACGDGDSPSGPANPTGPISLEVSAPAEIAPGESVQLIARARSSNGSAEDVTARVQWSVTTIASNSSGVDITISPQGVAQAQGGGQARIGATFQGLQGSTTVMVLPQGTFRFSGTVTDGPKGLAAVTLTVVSGVGAGLSAQTNDTGGFSLYGVNGTFRVSGHRDGYVDASWLSAIRGHYSGALFGMEPIGGRKDFSGTYRLTITTAANCSALPEAARQRTYTAKLTQSDGWWGVILSGAEFIPHRGPGNGFGGQIASTGEGTFWLGYYFGEYAIAERLGPVALLYDGTANVRADGDRITGTFDGQASISNVTTGPFEPIAARCAVDRFEMVKE
jgi:hypothetical protein